MLFCGGDATLTVDDRELIKKSMANMRRIQSDLESLNMKSKLLLLGAGESGKSTIFKQMRIINSSGYTSAELRQFRWIIHRNVIDGIKVLIEAARERDLDLDECNEDIADAILLYDGENISREMGEHVAALWADRGIKECFERRAEFQLGDGVSFFLNAVHRISAADYTPTVDDALHARVRTCGVVSKDFEIKGKPYQLYDVGGQRCERRNWLPLFDHVTAIIFVAAISEYNQVLAEDRSKNRIVEALELFEQLVNSKHFEGIDVLLFLNKTDLFEEKIKHIDPITWFPDYTGGCNAEKAGTYFKNAFEQRIHDKEKTMYSYMTCATDTNNMSVVFQTMELILLKDGMNQVM